VNLLELRGISKRFGGLTALNNVNFSVNRGEIVGLIGPNGAGKTTIINCISGVIRADAGSILLYGNDIVNLSPHQIYKLGIGRTFQKIELFPNMTVFESLLVGIQEKTGNSLIKKIQRHSVEDCRRVDKILEFLGIGHVAQMSPINISYGQQKLLDLGIALISEPDLICLDEPAGGVNPTMIEAIKKHIKKVNKAGQTFIIVEHQISLIMDLCDKVIVLDSGKKIMEGTPKEVQENPKVVEAYFGS
jgi:branched-chain amino acid transport system ATP-binding protein